MPSFQQSNAVQYETDCPCFLQKLLCPRQRCSNRNRARQKLARLSGFLFFLQNKSTKIHTWILLHQDNYVRMASLVSQLKANIQTIQEGGGAKATARHKSRGKLVARERVAALIDPSSPFLEFSQLAGKDLYGSDEVPAGGVVTGIGRIMG